MTKRQKQSWRYQARKRVEKSVYHLVDELMWYTFDELDNEILNYGKRLVRELTKHVRKFR